MDNIFLVAGIISVIFFIAKFLEMQYIEKESKPLKVLIRDTLVVYVSVVFGIFILEQLNPVIKETSSSVSPAAFTDNPPF
jgi:ABC-type phosphate transport system permease subunit